MTLAFLPIQSCEVTCHLPEGVALARVWCRGASTVHVKSGVVSLIAVVFGVMGVAWALDCEGQLVLLGHTPWEVQAICGEPTHMEDGFEILLKPVNNPAGHVVAHLPMAVPKSVWTYNFGPSRLVYLLTFREGKLVTIETGGYGH
jgi:Protein of unknown function (DUF2845)